MQHHSHYRAMLAIAVSALLPMSGNSHAAAALSAYRDEAELGAALARWRAAAQSRQQARLRSEVGIAQSLNAPAPAPAAGASPLKAGADEAAEASDSITNVQTAGVDEGGIVKRAGDHLVILRRGAASISRRAPRCTCRCGRRPSTELLTQLSTELSTEPLRFSPGRVCRPPT